YAIRNTEILRFVQQEILSKLVCSGELVDFKNLPLSCSLSASRVAPIIENLIQLRRFMCCATSRGGFGDPDNARFPIFLTNKEFGNI
ncbi:15186_t:CDS:1, partial [Acaulospora morrowiae]